MQARYEEWSVTGVPEGVDFKTTLNSAFGWSCPEFDIHPVGSKRDWNTQSTRYGKIVRVIESLLSKLQRASEIETGIAAQKDSGGSTYTSEKSKRLAIEFELDGAMQKLHDATKQFHQARHAIEEKEREAETAKVLEQRAIESREALKQENAELKRLLSLHSKPFRIVE